MLIALGVVISAFKWPFRSALFPVVIGSLVFFMSMTDLLLHLFSKQYVKKETKAMDFQLSEDMGSTLTTRRTVSIFLWILSFFFLIFLVGFPMAVPIFFFIFLKFKGREKWRNCLGLTALACGSFYGLFVWLLNIRFFEGWIQKGLRAVGVG
jgi:hypothetical protein